MMKSVIVVVFDILAVVLAQANCGPLCPPELELKVDEVIAAGSCACNPDLPVDNSSTPSCNCHDGGGWEQTCGDLNDESLSLTDLMDVENDSTCEEIQHPRIMRLCCRGNPNFICGDGGGEMTDPQRQLFQGDPYYTSCQSISDMLSLLDHNPMLEQTEAFYQDELELLKFDIDWASLCGCPNSTQSMICPVCGGDATLEIQDDEITLYAPDDYALADECTFPPYLTCPQAIAIAKSINNTDSCDGWILPVNASCCTGVTTNYEPSYAGDCGYTLEAAIDTSVEISSSTEEAIDTSAEEAIDTTNTEAVDTTTSEISTEEGTVNSSSTLKTFPFMIIVALVIGIVIAKLFCS